MGKVFLVGAGPGDPELLTLRAARLLAQADVVLHDALVSPEILRMIRPQAIVVDVGKRKGTKFHTQDGINELLIAYARAHKTVVSLKGGDPSLFGRAGEEMEALDSSAVEFEIVPGITAAMAGAAAAKISLTDSRYAASVIFVTAQRQADGARIPWRRHVATGSTLAIYMPGADYSHLHAELTGAGLQESTPCAIVSSATRYDQQVLWTDLRSLAHRNPLPAPSIVIVGECARALGGVRDCVDAYNNLPHPASAKTEIRVAPELGIEINRPHSSA
ncbi:MAG: uroporphyrinogen-III C-methyltransferase [Terriglobales bacterium]